MMHWNDYIAVNQSTRDDIEHIEVHSYRRYKFPIEKKWFISKMNHDADKVIDALSAGV